MREAETSRKRVFFFSFTHSLVRSFTSFTKQLSAGPCLLRAVRGGAPANKALSFQNLYLDGKMVTSRLTNKIIPGCVNGYSRRKQNDLILRLRMALGWSGQGGCGDGPGGETSPEKEAATGGRGTVAGGESRKDPSLHVCVRSRAGAAVRAGAGRPGT